MMVQQYRALSDIHFVRDVQIENAKARAASDKAAVKAAIQAARELAMGGSTANEKHAVFGKYKRRINNYLSKAGYDARKAEQNLKQPAVPPHRY